MLSWLLSLILTLILSAGAFLPGALDRTLTHELQSRLGPEGTASVHLEGDPFLQLPFGHIPSLEARLENYALFGPRLATVYLRLTDLKLVPGELYARRAVLAAPAGATLQAELTPEDLTAYMRALEARGALSGFKLPLVAGAVAFREPRARFQAGRLVVSGLAEIASTGARLPLEASAGLAVDRGAQVHLTNLRLAINGQGVPGFLLAPLLDRLNPVADLEAMALPPGEWRIVSLDLAPRALRLRMAGTLTALPAAR